MKTAVILAYNNGNAGMYSVDLAAFRLFESFNYPVDYFMVGGPIASGIYKYGQLPVLKTSSSDTFSKYDNIVYWGDFTTNPQYGMDDFFSLMFRHDGEASLPDAFEKWMRLFLLKGLDKGQRRIFSFGQNFQTLPVAAKQIDLNLLAPLYERFDAIMPRDSVSSRELAASFPKLSPDSLLDGTDCAFLLDETYADRPQKSGKVGGFLFRSKIENTAALSSRLSARGHVISNVRSWLALQNNNIHEHFRLMCEEMRTFDCVITDTYHFAVNAIREGATPIVLGQKDAEQVTTLSDYKKKVLLDDLGAQDLYVEFSGSTLDDDVMNRIIAKVDEITARAQPHGVHDAARRHAETALGRFRGIFLG